MKITLPALALSMALFALPSSAAIIGVDQSLTISDPPTQIVAANNPFDFLFTSLPGLPLTDATLSFEILADSGSFDEFFAVSLDGMFWANILETDGDDFNPVATSLNIPLFDLSSLVSDGQLLVSLSATPAIELGLQGDFITTRLTYRGESVPAPVPLFLILFGLAYVGLFRQKAT